MLPQQARERQENLERGRKQRSLRLGSVGPTTEKWTMESGLTERRERAWQTGEPGPVAASDITTAGTAQVTVVTPAPGGGTSAALTFTMNNPAPTLGSLAEQRHRRRSGLHPDGQRQRLRGGVRRAVERRRPAHDLREQHSAPGSRRHRGYRHGGHRPDHRGHPGARR